MHESDGADPPAGAPASCPLYLNRNGTCANYKWFNLCSGYIWTYSGWEAGEGIGVAFGGPSQPCVTPEWGCRVKRGIFYFRNIIPQYGQTVDLYLDADCNNDGCREGNLAASLNVDPGLRWNCIDFGACVPCKGLILRQVHDGGVAPSFVTDGPHEAVCDPIHPPTHSYYYGINGSTCVPWVGQPGTPPDDFLTWLIVNQWECFGPTNQTSWGAIKGKFQ